MRLVAACLIVCLPSHPMSQPVGMVIELNRLVPSENGCAATFVIENPGEAEIETYLIEAVIFDSENRVDRLTLFDFGSLPAEMRRVREFMIPSLECDRIGAILINGVSECAPAAAICDAPPRLTSRTGVGLE